jgi:glycosyltransferase involved in cell wall biosynthesis
MKVTIVAPAIMFDPSKRLDWNIKLASAIQKTGADITYFTVTTSEKPHVDYVSDVKVVFYAPTVTFPKLPIFLSGARFIWWSTRYGGASIYYKSALSLLDEVKKQDPDIIHFRGFFLTNLFSLPLSRMLSIPTVIEPLDVLYMQNPIRNEITKFFLKRATKIFTWGRERLDPMIHDYKISEEKIALIPSMGVDEKEFCPLDKEVCRKELDLDEDCKYILNVSNIPHKGFIKSPYELLPVLKELNRGKERYKLIMVGFGEIEEFVNEAKELGVDRDVIMAGFVGLPKLNVYYNAADVFLWPFSLGGPGIGRALTEAMACGLPTVAYRAKFNPTDEDCILYVPDGDRKAMAKKVVEIFGNDELRNKLIQNSLKRTEGTYTLSKVAEKIKGEYEKILASRRAARH